MKGYKLVRSTSFSDSFLHMVFFCTCERRDHPNASLLCLDLNAGVAAVASVGVSVVSGGLSSADRHSVACARCSSVYRPRIDFFGNDFLPVMAVKGFSIFVNRSNGSRGAGFSLWGFVLARTKTHRLKPAPPTQPIQRPAAATRATSSRDSNGKSHFCFPAWIAPARTASPRARRGPGREK